MKDIWWVVVIALGYWLVSSNPAPLPAAPVQPGYVMPAPAGAAPTVAPMTGRTGKDGGSTAFDPGPAVGAFDSACEAALMVGEQIYQGPDSYGACFTVYQGRKYFINAKGVRWLLGS